MGVRALSKRVNIATVAAEAGVGVGTVSRVLNGSSQVRDATRRQVTEVMERLHYQPSRLAAGLSRGTTGSVAVLVTFLTRPSVVQRVAGVIGVLDEEGYDTVVFNVETAEQRDRHVGALARQHRADGIIVMSLPLGSRHAQTLKKGGVPLVMVDADSPGLARFVIDNVAGGRLATEHLIGLGHHRIAFVGDSGDPQLAFTSTEHRLRGYRLALRDAGIGADPELVRVTPHGVSPAAEAFASAGRLLEMAQPPTAIFAASDTLAMGVLHAVEQRGLRVPDDLSVVGFDDIESAALIRLSTVRQPLDESGALAARRLCALLGGAKQRHSRTVLPLDLISRSSTSAPARAGRTRTHETRGRPPPRARAGTGIGGVALGRPPARRRREVAEERELGLPEPA